MCGSRIYVYSSPALHVSPIRESASNALIQIEYVGSGFRQTGTRAMFWAKREPENMSSGALYC